MEGDKWLEERDLWSKQQCLSSEDYEESEGSEGSERFEDALDIRDSDEHALFSRLKRHSREKVKEKEGEGASSSGGPSITTVPRFVVDLDLPPAQRWNEIAHHYKSDFKGLRQILEEEIAEMLGGKKKASLLEKLAGLVLGAAAKAGAVYYGKELKGLAQACELPLGLLVLMQLVYEAAAACTSVIVNDDNGVPIHIRTMDWGMDYLKPLTLELEFKKGGHTLFMATSWAGYVGVLTGMRPNGYSVSVNFRVTGEGYLLNFKKAMTYSWPIGFLVREVLESTSNFHKAVGYLSASKLIAPVYFSVAGTKTDEGVVLTRRRDTEDQRWTMEEHGPCVQTNEEWFSSETEDENTILYSLRRRQLAQTLLSLMQRKTEENMWAMMSRFPILNGCTLSGTFMCPCTGSFHTRLPQEDAAVGFMPSEEEVLPEGGAKRSQCTNCNKLLIQEWNVKGDCAHTGKWHATFGDCSVLKCGFGLNKKIGYQHWSCCFSTSKQSTCPKSDLHSFSD
ncbi:Acid ceramidase [Balamuthia mandrillaris]